MLAGGEHPQLVAEAVRELGATVLHAHNLHPLIGPRALRAAAAAGARVVLHLHNFRLFCAIGVAFRDGAPCFRCRGRQTLPGLALNCRGSLPEAATYAAALAAHLPAVLECVDRFLAPSGYAAGQLARLGVPAGSLSVLEHYLPAEGLAERSRADRGEFALVSARLAPEKGVAVAITGRPAPIASSAVSPKVSPLSEGTTAIAARALSASSARGSTRPSSSTGARRRSTRSRSSCSSGPAPVTLSGTPESAAASIATATPFSGESRALSLIHI